jgi:hypothetical protein
MSKMADKVRELRFHRMRLGAAAGRIEPLPSHPEIKIAIVPLTEAEHEQCLEVVTAMEVPETMVGALARDRRNQNEALFRALRDPENLEERAFETREEMMEALEVQDTNHLMDVLLEVSESDNPTPGEFSEEELAEVKKALEEVDLSGLSGRQWYALKRFLSTLGLTLLPANSLGSTSTNSVITTSDVNEFMSTADPNLIETLAKSAANQSS